jgi:NADH:ubiquinone oxidoreductase subunit F (NADH-binding)
MTPPAGHATAPPGTRPGGAARLTAGWQQMSRPATLPEHVGRYGPVPLLGRDSRGSRGMLADAITRAGLTGRGGAAFPTGTKIAAVAARHGPAVVVANGMESEPASEKDQALLARAPHLVLDGAVLAAAAVQADAVYVCVSRSRPWQAGQLAAAVAERQASRLDSVRIEIHDLPERYVASEETALVHWLNGGEAKPVHTPPRPFERGVGRRPTLVDNVETLAHIALIARYGPDWFRQAGTAHAPGTMLATICGAVAGPGVYEIELGTRVADALAAAGASAEASAVLIGGYFGTWHEAAAAADLPLARPQVHQAGARPPQAGPQVHQTGSRLQQAGPQVHQTAQRLPQAGAAANPSPAPGAGVLAVLPSGACGLTETARVLGYLAAQSAGQCGPCVFGLSAIADDFAQLASGRAQGPVLDRLDRRLGVVSGRGACHHPDGATRLAASALDVFAADALAHAQRRPCLATGRGRPAEPVLPVPRPDPDGRWR